MPLALFLVTLIAGQSSAAATQTAFEVLASAKSVECDYLALGTGDWIQGDPTLSSKATTLKIVFFNVTAQEGTAEVKGAIGGSYYIVVRSAGDYLHLMQVSRDGPIYMTSIYAKEVRPGRFLSVHSRHEYTQISLPGYTSRPEQYFGDCAVEG